MTTPNFAVVVVSGGDLS